MRAYKLPIHQVIREIKETLRSHSRLVLQAPPGAGKTTCVPLELLGETWLGNGKIIMLEPRRIAATSAARWMAKTLGESVGETVGYAVHLDKKVSHKSRIEVVTEGVFLGRLLNDPELKGISMVIFDEFHERSLEADLSLALLKESQEVLREDLKILIMSATLDAAPIASYLGEAPLITSEGKSYPVEIRYAGSPDKSNFISKVVSVILEALSSELGSLLVFLPGVGEINRVHSQLEGRLSGNDIIVQPLHGSLSPGEQEKAIEPVGEGKRKVVLATSIAESSITIKGIRVVIDGGLIRKPQFDPRTLMDSLETLQISKASADQRTGRAGRIESGVSYRLWDKYTRLDNFSEPGIKTEDLCSLALSLAKWGYSDSEKLQWLSKPNLHIFKNSRELLLLLRLVDETGITDKGEKVSKLPLHPRLGSMVLHGEKLGAKALACDLASLLSERDILSFSPLGYQSDLLYRVEALEGKTVFGGAISSGKIKRIRDYSRSMYNGKRTSGTEELSSLLLSAFPDRVAGARGEGLFQLANGSNASLPLSDSLSHEPYLIVPSLGGLRSVPKIFLACAITERDIMEILKNSIHGVEHLEFNREKNKFSCKKQLKLGHLILKEEKIGQISETEYHEVLLDYFTTNGLGDLNWSKDIMRFRDRVSFLHRQGVKGFPDFSEQTLAADLSWLSPFLSGISMKNTLGDVPLFEALKSRISWQSLKELEILAPSYFSVPSGSRIPIDYSGEEPLLKVRIQELFGLKETPILCLGKSPLVLHLLSPASRPIQITKDLKSFWEKTYDHVKKDLKGRYPRHYWPEDPLNAVATNRVKRKK